MITVIDCGVGNPASFRNMLRAIGVQCILTADPQAVLQAERILLPGVGRFDHFMTQLREAGLVEALDQVALQDRRPIMGVCVGAQALGWGSEEGELPGLGWLDLTVRRFAESEGFRVPRMGWGEVRMDGWPMAISLGASPRYYFAHSYYLATGRDGLCAGTTEYGITYAAAVHERNVVGVQFHPEKSHRFGMALLKAFDKWMP